MFKRALPFMSLTVSASLLLAACTPPAATQAPEATSATGGDAEVIRIYSSLPMTGSSQGQIITVDNAIKMAIEQQTEGGLVCDGKFKIDYALLDDAIASTGKWDAAQEQENATKAAADPDVMVYIGTFNSGAARVSIPILNAVNLAMISPANTAVDLTKGDDAAQYYPNGTRNYMRVVAADDFQGAFGARWAQKMGATKVYILDDTEVYGKGLADQFEKNATELGLEVLGRDGIDGKAADYKALATKIAGTGPELIYFGGITQNNAGQLLKDLRAAGITAPFMGGDGILEQAFIDAAGADVAVDTYATIAGAPFDKLPEKGKQFHADYEAKYGGKPEAYAIYGYEAASVALNAIKSVCKKDRAAILQAMITTKNFEGVLGTWSFDANGDTDLISMVGQTAEGGEWKEVSADMLP